jgi:twitching motility protein PilT
MATLDSIVCAAAEARCSDIHMAPGLPVRFRVDGKLTDFGEMALKASDTELLAREGCGAEEVFEELMAVGEVDLARTYSNGTRCRLNIFLADGACCLALRLLSSKIPDINSLGLPPAVLNFPSYQRGIVLVTGETGSGKSTTLASIVDNINHTRPDHIITLEDPIEYVYTPDKCSIDQREIGKDTKSFASGLRASLRQDPDVILVGEMRDLDTIETALTAAETGHLVFGTLHTQSAADSIDRLVDVFPEARQRQIRLQLSMTLKAVVSQQLLVRRGGKGRAVACEVMIVNPAIRNLIREGKTPQIENTLATTRDLGSITMDAMLVQMVKNHTIAADTAIEAAHDPDYVRRLAR